MFETRSTRDSGIPFSFGFDRWLTAKEVFNGSDQQYRLKEWNEILWSINYLKQNKCTLYRAENFRLVDIEINAWSSLFADLKTNLDFRLISRD